MSGGNILRRSALAGVKSEDLSTEAATSVAGSNGDQPSRPQNPGAN